MSKFKPGDKVRRIALYSHGILKPGDIATVKLCKPGDDGIKIFEDNGKFNYDKNNFELVFDFKNEEVVQVSRADINNGQWVLRKFHSEVNGIILCYHKDGKTGELVMWDKIKPV